MCHWYQFKTRGRFFVCLLFSRRICSQRGFIYLLLFPKAFYLAKSNINYFVSKTLCQHKHAVTSFPKESPVGSKSQLKFLSEPCWMFATWLLVGVTRLQNTDLKGRKPEDLYIWQYRWLLIKPRSTIRDLFWILSLLTKVRWNWKSRLHWLYYVEFIVINISPWTAFRLTVLSSLWLILQVSYPDAQHTLTFLPMDVSSFRLYWSTENKDRGREKIAAHLIPPQNAATACT